MVAQGDRPVRPQARRIDDYLEASGVKRRTGAPVGRRQQQYREEEEELEERDVFIGRGRIAEGVGQGGGPAPVEDRGGAQQRNDQLPDGPALLPLPESDDESEEEINQMVNAFSAAVRPEDSPRNWKEAMTRPDRDQWQAAAQTEVDALEANKTWDLVQLPEGHKTVGSKWVFLIKRKADGTIDRYKARLVAQGFSQRPGVNFDQTFAPTARLSALRAILAQAAIAGEFIESLDISNAYLNGDLEPEYEVYMEQPEGFRKEGPEVMVNGRGRWVCRLKKGLYGLKQSGRLWYHKLRDVLEGMGFTQIKSDPSIYVFASDDIRIILPVFVDDITMTSRNRAKMTWVKETLGKVFKLKDLGPTTYLLGIKVEYDRPARILRLSQKQYIIDMLTRYGLQDCKPSPTPMDPGLQLSKTLAPANDEEVEYMKKVPYMSAVGALMYLAIGTRPDIAYAVGKLAQFNSNPGPIHWEAVKRVFRYLKGTIDLRLTYREDGSADIFTAYSDSDYAGCIDTRKSTTGYALKMGTGAVSWSSKKQTFVALSSTEAEYVAASITGQEVVWMRSLLQELHFKVNEASPLNMDNQSAIAAIENPEHHGRMKQVDVRYHWIRDGARFKRLRTTYLPTEEMPADMLTKPLSAALIERHRLDLGLM